MLGCFRDVFCLPCKVYLALRNCTAISTTRWELALCGGNSPARLQPVLTGIIAQWHAHPGINCGP